MSDIIPLHAYISWAYGTNVANSPTNQKMSNGSPNTTKETARIALSDELQLILVHEHEAAHKPYETAALTALVTRGEDVVAGS